jgi:hypothetical protein
MMTIMRMRSAILTIAYCISIMFPFPVITAARGKLYVIDPVFSIDCGGLGATFLSHHFLVVKGFLM